MLKVARFSVLKNSCATPSRHNLPHHPRALLLGATFTVGTVLAAGDDVHLGRGQLAPDLFEFSGFGPGIALAMDQRHRHGYLGHAAAIEVGPGVICRSGDIDPGPAVALNAVEPMVLA